MTLLAINEKTLGFENETHQPYTVMDVKFYTEVINDYIALHGREEAVKRVGDIIMQMIDGKKTF